MQQVENTEVRFKSPLRKSFVYFIQDGDYIKIGKSTDPLRRMFSLMVTPSVKLKLLKTIECGSETEALMKEHKLHNHFAKHRCEMNVGSGRTEWFKISETDIKDCELYCELSEHEKNYLEWYVPRLYDTRERRCSI